MEKDSFLKLVEGASAEITEKKSRFIATIRPVASEEDAVRFIDEIRKQNWDAKHNCYAYIIGENPEITKCSDDGEPSQTAGRPMLEVLAGSEIKNIAVVVTRYFGGILLGTGGLVRAYQGAVKEALKNCTIARMMKGAMLAITTDYTSAGRIQYILGEQHVEIIKSEYLQNVRFEIFVSLESKKKLEDAITEATSGKGKIEELEICFRENFV